MKPEDHLEKAKEIERSISKLEPDADWALIIEGVYNASLQYLACYCEVKYHQHRDTHRGLESFLNKLNEQELGALFTELNVLRTGRWYGGKRNGEAARRALSILEKFKGAGLSGGT